MRNIQKKEDGITLIALVVTIVVLIILAAISINVLTGNNGIINQSKNAKEETEISEEKETVQISAVQAAGKDKFGNITEDNLAAELTSNIGERDVDYTLDKEGENFIVTYIDTNRSYLVQADGNVELAGIQSPEEIPEEKPEVSTETAFSRAYGVIEIEFLSGTSYNSTTIPNEPKMTSDMKKVYWENGIEKVEGESIDFDESKWYTYIAQTSNTETGGTSKWANAKTSDGSYWVWIPRYAYRIVYFDTVAHRNAYRKDNTQTEGIVGYSDARGLVNKDGKTPSDIGEPVTSIAVGTNKLRPHPAFENGRSTGYTQGEWDDKLEGIWVAKYEMSEKSEKTIKSIPGVISYRSLEIGDMYTKSYDYDREKESHLMKNSEWGAVTYLTDSKYGRNGTAVSKNIDINYSNYTAGANLATPATNPLQSTTGNEYGIFDTAGGASEFVAGYIADSSNSYGNSFASIDNTTNNKTESTKYATVYQMADSNTSRNNYAVNINKIFGDAIVETSRSGGSNDAWQGVTGVFPGINTGYEVNFFSRGGVSSTISAGIFGYARGYKGYSNDNSYRVCLIIK